MNLSQCRSASATLQRLVNTLLAVLIGKCRFIYLETSPPPVEPRMRVLLQYTITYASLEFSR